VVIVVVVVVVVVVVCRVWEGSTLKPFEKEATWSPTPSDPVQTVVGWGSQNCRGHVHVRLQHTSSTAKIKECAHTNRQDG